MLLLPTLPVVHALPRAQTLSHPLVIRTHTYPHYHSAQVPSSLMLDVGRLTVISPLSLCGQRVLSLLVLGNLMRGVLLADLSLTVGSSSLGNVDHCE